MITIGPPSIEGRTVREIVDDDPGQVTEVWCRKLLRNLLQSLQRQYAMHVPHLPITPDTVLIHDNGLPLLMPCTADAAVSGVADDLPALAKIIHYAITGELEPMGPLQGRRLPDYSASLIAAVDRCMASDPAQRPRSIDELRSILGIVAVAQVPMVRTQAPRPRAQRLNTPLTPTMAPRPTPPAWWVDPQRQAWAACMAAIVLLGILLVFFSLRDSARVAETIHARRQGPGVPYTGAQPPALSPPAPRGREPGRLDRALAPASRTPAIAGRTGFHAGEVRTPPAGTPGVPANARTVARNNLVQEGSRVRAGPMAADPAQANGRNVPIATSAGTGQPAEALPAAAPPASAIVFKLQIAPWGTVYVDGIERGVSPPNKRLVLGPGRHTVTVRNPNFLERVIDVDTTRADARIVVDFNEEP